MQNFNAPLTITLPPMCALDPNGIKSLCNALTQIKKAIPEIMDGPEEQEAQIAIQCIFGFQIDNLKKYLAHGWGETIEG